MPSFTASGTVLSSRSLLEMMYEAAEGDVKESGAKMDSKVCEFRPGKTLLAVRVPVRILKDNVRGKLAQCGVTLTMYDNTGTIRIQGPQALDLELLEYMQDVESFYADLTWKAELGMKMPEGFATIMQYCRKPCWAETLHPGKSEKVGATAPPGSKATTPDMAGPSTKLPQGEGFKAAIRAIAETADLELDEHPEWKNKLMHMLRVDFGLARSCMTHDASATARPSSSPVLPTTEERDWWMRG